MSEAINRFGNIHRRGLPTCWDASPAGRRTVQSVWQWHLLQSWIKS